MKLRTIGGHLALRTAGVPVTESISAVLDELDGLDDTAVVVGAPLRDLAMRLAHRLDALEPGALAALPLAGVPFAVKDNIDVAGVPTTCACPSAARVAEHDASVVARLIEAGAVPVAKVNLDQFATGLVGTRSPLGTPRNPLAPEIVPGGSSSGSAVAVALGLVPFSLGTDTAGSGRVPASMCGIVGLKPSLGRLSTSGVFPAVRRVDCVSVFATTVADAALVAELAAGFDPSDPYSRPASPPRSVEAGTIGVPDDLAALGADASTTAIFADALLALEKLGYHLDAVPVEWLFEAGSTLYGGPLVAEREVAFGSIVLGAPDADPVVRSIVGRPGLTAADAYRAEYDLAVARRRADQMWARIDALALPTVPNVPTLTEVAAEPVSVNAGLGRFTTFANLLDMAAVVVPVGRHERGAGSGLQLLGPAWSDRALVALAGAVERGERPSVPARVSTPERIDVIVVGAHLTGQPLNHQLTGLGGALVSAVTTSERYRLYALAGTVPPKPGLVRVADDGATIAAERWSLPLASFGAFVNAVPEPLCIGTVELSDGTWCKGFLCEPRALEGAIDITVHGGWRAYLASAR